MELWGGLECTMNRVGDTFFDQHVWSGHRVHMREDLRRIAALGIRTLRVALHWEYWHTERNWDFFDATLEHMQQLGITPIVGLVHHGSGPRGTDLLDPAFPYCLAEYASAVAARYPHVTRYTPINEPHTTARFSCLYGHWYPHHRSLPSYLCALLHQAKATALTMQAIRRVQPRAELIYTEDGGTTFAPPQLEAFRVDREARRWLGVDLLCGQVDEQHPLFDMLLENGMQQSDLAWFRNNPCPPSVLGFNYYPTSDRYLDDRVHLYPSHFRGGDAGTEPLVDIEAVRVHVPGICGVGDVLREAWQRYGIPVAITEAHLGGACDDQIHWLTEVWHTAQAARAEGVDVQAVTVWALLGSWNWPVLCTGDHGLYEPGVFHLQDDRRDPTPLAAIVQQIASGSAPPPQTATPWWRHPSRLTYQDIETESLACATS